MLHTFSHIICAPLAAARLFALGAVMLLLAFAPVRGDEVDRRVREAITRLSHHSFSVRTRAERTLRQIGAPARQPLVEALSDHDAETRQAARRILQHILRERLYAQIRQFRTIGPDATDSPIAGWLFFRDHVGDSFNAREHFIAAVRAEPVLIESLELDPTYSSEALQSRTQTLYDALIRNPGRNPGGAQGPGPSTATSFASVSALLIVAANSQVPLEDDTAQKLFQLMQHSGLTHQLTAEDQPSTRRLVGHFVRRSAGTPLAYQMLWLSMQCNLPEGLVPAEVIIREKTPQPYVLQNAMLAIAKLGDREHVPLLESYLEDEKPVNNRRSSGFQPQIRDVALAATIHLHGKDPKQFGFTHLRPNSHTLFQPGTMGFDSPEKRKAAFARWSEWKTQRPTDSPEAP